MNTAFRILEISLYALANFIPYLLLSLYTFSRHYRFSKIATGFISFLSVLVQVLTRFYAAHSGGGSNTTITIIRLLSYLILFLIAVDLHFGKLLFVQIIFSNIGNFISIASTCLEGMMFADTSHRLYCWHISVIMMILHIVITLPFALTITLSLKIMVDRSAVGKKWNYFWLIPATFYFIWVYQLYGTRFNMTFVVRDPKNMVFLLIINAGAFLIYYIVIWLDNQMAANLELERKNHFQDIEQLEYRALHERMEETRRVRHDLRHHIVAMTDYLKNQEYEQLKEYLDRFEKSIPETPPFLFCQNRAVNRLLFFFATQAKEHEIDFQVKTTISDDLDIPVEDISVLLGNLLENALDACVEQKEGEKKIMISGKGDKNSLFFTIDNTYDNKIKRNHTGQFLSTKSHGSGIGIVSAKHIVMRYNGVFAAEAKDGMFFVSFMLNL